MATIELNGEELPPDKLLFPIFTQRHSGKPPILSFITSAGNKSVSETSLSTSLSFLDQLPAEYKPSKLSVGILPAGLTEEKTQNSSPTQKFETENLILEDNWSINREAKKISRMEVLPTFEVIRQYADDEKGKREPEIREWNVIKINNKGRRQKRILGITFAGIENVRARTGTVSSTWTWGDIRTVFRVDKNKVNFKLSDSKVRVYVTDEAEELLKNVQEHIAYHNLLEDASAFEDISKKIHKRFKDQRRKGDLRESFEWKVRDTILDNVRYKHGKSKVEQQVESWLNNKETKFSQYVKNFVVRWKKLYRKQGDCLHSARCLMDQLKDAIMDEEATTLNNLAFPNKRQLSEEDHIVVESEVDKSIEQYVVPQILDDLVATVTQENSVTTNILMKNSASLKNKDLGFFHCSEKVMQMSKLHNWDGAMLELIKLPRQVLPSEKLRVVDDTVSMIYSLAATTQIDSKLLSGDDLLPILIYVMVKATNKLKKLCYSFADHHFIDQLISKDNLSGDKEYYLTVFEACLCYLAHPSCLT